MPRTRHLIRNVSFAPIKLKMLTELLEEVWASLEADFSNHPDHVESARIQLAAIVVDLAKDYQLGPLQITRTAGRLMRQTQRETKKSRRPLRLHRPPPQEPQPWPHSPRSKALRDPRGFQNP